MAFPVSPTEGQTFTENNTVWIYSAVMGQWNRSVINPLNETLYKFGSASATGSAGEIQYTDGTNLAASPNLLWDNANNELEVGGDVILDDGGTYTTTLQTITPTANRTVSLPNATGTVALVAGSSGQFIFNNAGALGGSTVLSIDGSSNITQNAGRYLLGVTSANTNGGALQLSGGITFPATQAAASDPNTLDDYEEGTWTPTISGLTGFDAPSGAYTKVGRMVYCSFFISGTYLSAYTVSNPVITGFPFSYTVNQLATGSAAILRYDNMGLIAGPVAIAGNGEIRMVLADTGTNSPSRGFGGQFSYRINS